VVTRTGAGPDAAPPRESATRNTEEGTPASSTTRRKRSKRRTYTIRAGDTPSGIAERTGVPVARLLDLNPDLDAQALQTGAKLKLR
jgi:LysM repeat protein